MKKMILIFLLLLSNILFINAQRNWSVKSEDDLVKARNYIGFEEGRDSVIVKTPQQSFRFSNHYPLSEILRSSEIDASFTIRSIKKVNDKVYLLTGIGGNLEFETELSLIFINQNKILKYIVVKSYDKRLREIEFYYDEKNNELIFPIRIENRNDEAPIYDIDLENNRLIKIVPLQDISEYQKSKFSFNLTKSNDIVFYKVKFY